MLGFSEGESRSTRLKTLGERLELIKKKKGILGIRTE